MLHCVQKLLFLKDYFFSLAIIWSTYKHYWWSVWKHSNYSIFRIWNYWWFWCVWCYKSAIGKEVLSCTDVLYFRIFQIQTLYFLTNYKISFISLSLPLISRLLIIRGNSDKCWEFMPLRACKKIILKKKFH